MEMTLNNLMSGPTIDHQDFLSRAAILGALDKTVMISNYTRFDRVTTYLRQYTQNRISMVVGIPTLRGIFEEKYYEELQGGILEGLGRLFRGPVKLFAYPTLAGETGELETAAKSPSVRSWNTCMLTCSRMALSRRSGNSRTSSSISIPAMY